MRLRALLVLLLWLVSVTASAATVFRGYPGEVVLIPVKDPRLEARFRGHLFRPLRLREGLYLPLALPLDTPPGIYTLRAGGLSLTVRVLPKSYPEEHLRLPPRMVTFPPEILARVRREIKLLRGTLGRVEGRACRLEDFVLPVSGKISSPFGLRRILNGEPRSPHRGVDLAVPEGTPVRAASAGRVILTGDFYLPGRVVLLGHGCGVYTYYAHLSRILVRKGERVRKGQIIALSGATGRTTGPHLHFGVYLSGVAVNPVIFIQEVRHLYGRKSGGPASAS
ncbi:M23 family metallopeptidase [Thermosulfurimonas sp.]|uniref:M23 family metallopeptidase n=1 Tax=Thermosulfurimonas sp. TaxID=2080236 RepID=UPI0025D18638|nr:M23 family metallopeptidase [Thermosulfurimonas sp.]